MAAVTSNGHWLIEASILEYHGFQRVASAPPCFDLMVLKFDLTTPDSRFCGNWEQKLQAKGDGLLLYRSGQCPYLDDTVMNARAFADEA